MADGRALALVIVSVALTTAGCGSEEARSIDWDLSRSHTIEDVDWPNRELDATSLEPIESVRIRLPGGKVFEAGDEVHDVNLKRGLGDRAGELVLLLRIDSEPLTTEDANELALRWASLFGLPTEPIEAWYEQRLAGREGEGEDVRSTALSASPAARLAPGGPVPAVQIRYSFEDDRPSIAALELAWAGDGQ